MKPKLTPLKIAPAKISYHNGKAIVEITIANTELTDWITKKALQSMFDIKSRTLQTLRSTKRIPSSKLGNKIYYYKPGILALLENNVYYK